MSEIQVASRYAKSLIDLAQEQNSLEQVKGDIDSFIQVVHNNSQLQAILKNPIINPDKKLSILTSLFGSRFGSLIMSYFKIVVSKGRSGILYATAKEFVNEYNRRKGVINASVTSAVPLTEANMNELKAMVSSATQKEVILETKVDPALIGGFVLKVGDRQYDTSIASSLTRLKKEFAQN